MAIPQIIMCREADNWLFKSIPEHLLDAHSLTDLEDIDSDSDDVSSVSSSSVITYSSNTTYSDTIYGSGKWYNRLSTSKLEQRFKNIDNMNIQVGDRQEVIEISDDEDEHAKNMSEKKEKEGEIVEISDDDEDNDEENEEKKEETEEDFEIIEDNTDTNYDNVEHGNAEEDEKEDNEKEEDDNEQNIERPSSPILVTRRVRRSFMKDQLDILDRRTFSLSEAPGECSNTMVVRIRPCRHVMALCGHCVREVGKTTTGRPMLRIRVRFCPICDNHAVSAQFLRKSAGQRSLKM